MKNPEKTLFYATIRSDDHSAGDSVRQGLDPAEKDQTGRTPLHIATSRGCVDAMESMITSGVDVNVKDHFGNTPLHACGHLETLILLYNHGADINALNKAGHSPLVLAQRRGVPPIIIEQLEQWSNMVNTREAPPPTLCSPGHLSMWNEFCVSVGPIYLIVLLICLVFISMCAAYVITGYHGETDTRIPVNSMKHVEL